MLHDILYIVNALLLNYIYMIHVSVLKDSAVYHNLTPLVQYRSES
jgi:hypothetical protein